MCDSLPASKTDATRPLDFLSDVVAQSPKLTAPSDKDAQIPPDTSKESHSPAQEGAPDNDNVEGTTEEQGEEGSKEAQLVGQD